MIRRWPAWRSRSGRRGPRRSSAGPVRYSRTRSAKAASPRWPCPAPRRFRVACPSSGAARVWAPSALAETLLRKTKTLPRPAPQRRRRFDEESMNKTTWLAVALTIVTLAPQGAAAQVTAAQEPPYGRPDALIDLRTADGARLVKGQWRYRDTKIIEADFRGPGPDLKPSGKPIKTYDYIPHAGGDFDDSGWEVLDPSTLDARRSTGRLCFNWYRIRITIPEKVANSDTAGSTV